jgi:hypothetical protein
MSTGYHIRYLRRHEIDAEQWDHCVHNAPNGWLYLQSFFLDGLGPWDALVATPADTPTATAYSYIMPLPKKKKWIFWYCPVPPFVGQLGIVGPAPVSPGLVDDFLKHLPPAFILADLLLNEQNPAPSLPGVDLRIRTNYVLPLAMDYSTLYSEYTPDAQKNLRRAARAGLRPISNVPVEKVITLYRAAYGSKSDFLSAADYVRIAAISAECIKRKKGFTLGITDGQNNLCAAAFFGIDEKRIYYLLGAPSEEGRRHSAVHLLIDEVIKRYAGSALQLDFEGSDIPSVAAFYRKFNPERQSYPLVRISRLPRWLLKPL